MRSLMPGMLPAPAITDVIGIVKADGPASTLLTDRDLLEEHDLELPLRLQGPPGD